MNFWPSFSSWHFALAGLVAAAGPVIIHLLNRRRYRVVHWAAMDFLREALQRNRRILQIRDLILLALRTAAVLLFGLALARPYFAANAEKYDGTQPLHAVLLIDNSLSMGYQSLAGSLLDQAKQRAREFIDKLPRGSRITIVPLCGSASGSSPDPFDTKDAAVEALDRIEVVDRAASMQRAVNEARRACEAVPELAKRLVLIGDQQRSNWSDWQTDALEGLPALQVVQVRSDQWENTWVSEVKLPDGLADVETPTTIVAEVQHRGPTPRRDVQVTLWVEDRPVASQTITVDPTEGARQVLFEHVFDDQSPEAGRELFVPVRVTLSPDSLPEDDERHLIVPVVAALPVVFVDQFGAEDEDPVRRRLGETRQLRKLLAPVTRRDDNTLPLIRIRHVTVDQLNRDLLADARLVVVAGIARPGETVTLLREFVEQGGQLLIAAGGEFDAEVWNETAWLDGAGILPGPLKPIPFGATPEEAGAKVAAFQLAVDSLATNAYFQIPDTSEDDLRDLYSEPYFFKAIEVDLTDELAQKLRDAEIVRLTQRRDQARQDVERKRTSAGRAAPTNANATERSTEGAPDDVALRWLQWSRDDGADETTVEAQRDAKQIEALASTAVPHVLARFATESKSPFLVERRIGAGQVTFVASGVLSNWNTLPKTNTMFLFDRMLRGMIQATLSRRNFDPQERLTVPLATLDPQQGARLRRPGQSQTHEVLDIGFIGRDQRGVTIANALQRGTYRIELGDTESSESTNPTEGRPEDNARSKPKSVALAVNGPAAESDLTLLSEDKREALIADARVRWINPGEGISLAGAQLRGQDSWWYLVALVLAVLLIELAVLARSNWMTSTSSPTAATPT